MTDVLVARCSRPGRVSRAAGEFVLRTDPHTESHPMALLSQFLVAFGTASGGNAHYAVEASRHHANEFIVLVGPSRRDARGRAGITSRR